MGGRIRRAYWLLPFFLFHALVFAEEDCALQFVKGPERVVVANVYEDILSIALSEREMEGTLLSFGKAHRLSDKLLDKLKAKDRQLYNQAQKITSALKIGQGNNEFYLRAFDSIELSKLRVGSRVRCRIVLLEIRSKDAVAYLPLIRTIRIL